MRIIAGRHKGRRLDAPDWQGLRPTGDRLRETLFNILAPRMAGARVLDGCAGTGAVGIEALSRGAIHVTFVDRDPRAAALVARNLQRCGIEEGYAIIRADLVQSAAGVPAQPYDLIFLDPPYDTDPVAVARTIAGRLQPDGLLVIEHRRGRVMPDRIEHLARTREVPSGDSALAFYAGVPAGADTGANEP
jgi:16S rRNA (guanine(966)-N(2))-methyltransferase RsmD